MEIEKVLIVGAGTMGGQIGFQCAVRGLHTAVFDIDRESLETCRRAHRGFAKMFVAAGKMDGAEAEAALARLSYTTDLSEAAREADLVSESVPEDPGLKRRVYAELDRLCPVRTIFTTNSSTLVPSQLADATGRPGRFLALHFANPVWQAPIGEVMGHPGTEPEVVERVVSFAEQIGMVPIRLDKEHHGYVINALLMPFLGAGLELVANGVACHETVDRTWMIATRMAIGPCGIMDLIGLETIFNVTSYWAGVRNDRQLHRNAAFVKESFVDRGRLGVKTGSGFYSYPNPAYGEAGFLSPSSSPAASGSSDGRSSAGS